MSIRSGQLDPGRFPHPNLAGFYAKILSDNTSGYVAAVDVNGKAVGFSFNLARRWSPGWPTAVRFEVALGSDGLCVFRISGLNQFGDSKTELISLTGDGANAKIAFTQTCYKRVDSITLVSEATTAAANLIVGWAMNAANTGVSAHQQRETAFALPCKIGSAVYGGILATQAGALAQVAVILMTGTQLLAAEVTLDTANHAVRSFTDTNWVSAPEISGQFYFGQGTDP